MNQTVNTKKILNLTKNLIAFQNSLRPHPQYSQDDSIPKASPPFCVSLPPEIEKRSKIEELFSTLEKFGQSLVND